MQESEVSRPTSLEETVFFLYAMIAVDVSYSGRKTFYPHIILSAVYILLLVLGVQRKTFKKS